MANLRAEGQLRPAGGGRVPPDRVCCCCCVVVFAARARCFSHSRGADWASLPPGARPASMATAGLARERRREDQGRPRWPPAAGRPFGHLLAERAAVLSLAASRPQLASLSLIASGRSLGRRVALARSPPIRLSPAGSANFGARPPSLARARRPPRAQSRRGAAAKSTLLHMLWRAGCSASLANICSQAGSASLAIIGFW